MSELAEKLILENIKTKNPTLDLGNCGLDGTEDELYKPLRDARHLETLIFSNRYLKYGVETQEPEWIESQNQGQGNRFTNFSFLLPKNLSKLIIVGDYTPHWKIDDLSCLKDLTKLQKLDCSLNQIQDLTSLTNLKCLEDLNFVHNKIQNLESIRYLYNLNVLSFSYNQIQSLEPIENLEKLQILNFASNEVQNLMSIKGLRNLKILNFNLNQVQDLLPLKDLENLQAISCWGNQIQSLEPIKNSQNLQGLNLNNNQIQDISVLKELKNLQFLNLENNPIQSISFIQNLKNLEGLEVDYNFISYPPIWFVLLKSKGGKLGEHSHLQELPQVEKIWQIMQSKDEENINLAHQLALGQGWTEEEFEMYQKLL